MKRSFCSLHQSLCLWYRILKEALNRYSFEDFPDIICVIRGLNAVLLIYVDDLILLYRLDDAHVADKFE